MVTKEHLEIADPLRSKIRTYMHEIADNLATGKAKDWEDYNKQTGMIAGLAHAERALLDILESLDIDS